MDMASCSSSIKWYYSKGIGLQTSSKGWTNDEGNKGARGSLVLQAEKCQSSQMEK
jgi:hypothetical protein